MSVCPRCQRALLPASGECPSCSAPRGLPPPVRIPPRRGASAPVRPAGSPRMRWVWPAYRAVCVYWIGAGALGVAQALGAGGAESPGNAFDLGVGALAALVGLGLLLHIEVARGVANVLSFLMILSGLFSLLTGFMAFIIAGAWGLLVMLTALLDIVTGGLMIFLIGETDTRAPNL